MSKRLTTEEFKKRAIEIHKGFYSYENTIYKSMKEKVSITCPTHREFWQNPADHLMNHGCPKCKADKASCDINDIKQLFEQIHKEKYTYDFSTYKRNSIKMKMICPEHGEFWQKPELHKNGSGCKKCTASGGPGKYCESIFSKKPELKYKQGTLYFIQLTDSNGTIFFKIGITMSMKKRFYNFIKNNNGHIVWTYNDTLYKCFEKEQKLLIENKEFKYVPLNLTVGGKHECFLKEIHI